MATRARDIAGEGGHQPARARYPRKAEIDRVVAAARAAGITPGGLRVGPDGTIEVLQQAQAVSVDDPYEQWKAGRKGR